MELKEQQNVPTQRNLSDYRTNEVAPMVFWGGMNALTGNAEVKAALAQVRAADPDHTTWRVVWLTADHVIYGEATKDREGWTAYDRGAGGQDPDSSIFWRRPRAEITSLELQGLSSRPNEWGRGDWNWRIGICMTFRDGTTISAPMFPDLPGDYRTREQIESLLTELVPPYVPRGAA